MAYFLVPQAFALLLGAAILFPGSLSRSKWHQFRRAAVILGAVGVVASAVALALVEERLWDQRAAAQELSPFERRTRGGELIGVRVRFVERVRHVIPPGDNFRLLIGRRGWSEGYREGVREWTAYRLHPRTAVDETAAADWLVFYGRPPDDAERSGFDRLRVFGEGYAVARRSR